MSKSIRFGIVGTGAIAALFAEGLHALPDAKLVAVGSRTRESADSFARDYGVPRAHGTYEALARDPEIDVLYVATPNSLHEEHCLLALENGKAVLCEKPFALDAGQSKTIVAAARKHRLFCMEGMWMRFVPVVVELRKLLRQGIIGDVRMITAQLGFPWEFDPKHRLFDPELGGGALLDLGVYPLSLAFHLLGTPTSFVTQAVLGKTGVDEQAGVLLTFEGERQAAITTSLRSGTSNDATIVGTEGVIHLHTPIYCPERMTITRTTLLRGSGRPKKGLAGKLKQLKQLPFARDLQNAVAHARSKTITKRALGNGYTHEAIEVIRCLREGALESPIMPLDETQAIMETMDAIRHAWTAKPAGRA